MRDVSPWLPYHDLIDTYTQQDFDHTKLFFDVALYSARVMSPAHVENIVTIACRSALAGRGVAHLAITVDVQEEPENSRRSLKTQSSRHRAISFITSVSRQLRK
jgi:pyruvate dehydrogenase (quinone)